MTAIAMIVDQASSGSSGMAEYVEQGARPTLNQPPHYWLSSRQRGARASGQARLWQERCECGLISGVASRF